ncbi:MAG: WhiB family transcriptional regulator, partial [Candidatus Nanopelagicaceae bacterium]
MAEISRLPMPTADNWEWQFEGACRNYPAEMFFHPEGERGPSR